MMHLAEAAQALNAKLIGNNALFTSVGSDSRHIAQGQLFVALKGEHFDGHDYVRQALTQGAAALVERPVLGAEPLMVVENTYQALGKLASYWREKFTLPVVAVTGSNGKTTVKEMICSILAATTGDATAIHATVGNLNNHIGLPITLLKLHARHQYSVLEMGMNHLGEIDYLTRIAKPTVAVINNAGTAHIGEVGSQEKIAEAKGEVFAGLCDAGAAVINADDPFADYWKSLNPNKKILTFGLNKNADVHAEIEEIEGFSQLHMRTRQGNVSFKLGVLGAHNIHNALAASAAAVALGVSNANIAAGLSQFSAVKSRLQRKAGLNGSLIIDDTYNANPDSMKAAIDVLSKQVGEKILVLGDMGELGTEARRLHAEIGAYAKFTGLAQLYCLGDLAPETLRGFGESQNAQQLDSPEAIAQAIKPLLNAHTVVLIKGSRFMKMERVVFLLEETLSHRKLGEKS